jgi:hypothetical protein
MDAMKNKNKNFDTTKEVGLEVNVEKTKYILLYCHQNAGQNYNIKRANRLLHSHIFGKNSNKSKLNQEEIKRRLKPGNACYHSFFCFQST